MSRPAAPPRVWIVCGSGGVGKTTTSAALALKAARSGLRVALLTIDPARRLADALHVRELGNTAVSVPVVGLPPSGALDAMMLDAQRTFDEVVERFSPTPEARDRILSNHYYRSVSNHLPGAHEYMAMEKLHALAQALDPLDPRRPRYDLIVVDTPPTRHALDFLAAPDRMAKLMDEGVMRWLVLPASRSGWRMLEKGSEAVAKVLEGVLGQRTISDIAEFFGAFQALWEGFRERSLAVRALLRAPTTRFVLVSSPAPASRSEALEFLAILEKNRMPFGGFLLNRCILAPPTPPQPLAFPPAPAGVSEADWRALTDAIAAAPAHRQRLADAQEESIHALATHAPAGGHATVWKLPDMEGKLHDLASLDLLAPFLPSADALR